MNSYNTQFGAKDIFQNSAFAGVFPQFTDDQLSRNVYSMAEIEKRVADYLVTALNGTRTADMEITVKGQKQSVMNRVRGLQPLIEGLFNNFPKVRQAIRKNAPLYLPYATAQQIKDIKTPAQKQRAMKVLMDNFQYSDDFGASNFKGERPDQFRRNKKSWETRVGYRRLKKV